MFHVGQHVVCVDDEPDRFMLPGHRYCGDLDGLRRGAVYTVRRVGGDWQDNPVAVVWLLEIHRVPGERDPEEPPFAAPRFRPVDETKLSIFRELLVTPPKEPALID